MRCLTCLDCGLDVFTANSATDPSAGDLCKLNSCLACQLADDRRYIAALGNLCGGRSGRLGHLASFCSLSQGCGSREGIYRCGGSRCRSLRCRGSRNRCLLNRSRRCCCRSSGCHRFTGGSRGSLSSNHCKDSANLNGLIFRYANFCEEAGSGSRNFGVHLIGRNLNQGFIGFNCVANGLEPGGDGAFCYRFAECRHDDLGSAYRCRGRRRSSGCGVRLGSGRRRRCAFLCGSRGVLWGLGSVTNERQLSADLDGFVFGNKNLKKDACRGGRNFRVDLVGGNFDQGLIECDGIAH